MGCSAEPVVVAQDAAKPLPPFEVELVGAKAWRKAAPPIFSDEKRPRIIYPAEIGAVQAFVGDRAATLVEAATSAGHVAYEVVFEAPKGAFELRVVDAAGRERRWTIEWPSGDVAEAFARIDTLIRAARAQASTKGRASEASRKAAARTAETAGLMSVAAGQWRAIAYFARQRTDLSADTAALAEAERLLLPADAAGRVGLGYHQGLAAKLAGDFKTASARLERTVAQATWLGHAGYAYGARSALAGVQVRQGRIGAAMLSYGATKPRATRERQSEKLSFWHLNIAWALLTGMLSGAIPVEFDLPVWHFEEAYALFDSKADRADVLANLADALLRAGAPGAARAAIDIADDLDQEGRTVGAGWRRVIAAELAQLRGDWSRAEATYRSVACLGPARGDPDPETSWRAVTGLADLYGVMGDIESARAMYDEAGRRIDRLAGGVQLADDAGAFYAGRRTFHDDWARFLLSDARRGGDADLAAAWSVIEASQARVVRALRRAAQAATPEARERSQRWLEARNRFEAARSKVWTVPLAEQAAWQARQDVAQAELESELRALLDAAPGSPRVSAGRVQAALPVDAVLLSFRRLGQETHVFLLAADEIAHRTVRGVDLIGPWAERLRSAKHVFWIPGNVTAAERFDQHLLDGKPLAFQVSQSRLPYAGLLTEARPATDAAPLVVADPEGNLRWSRDEAMQLGGRRLMGEVADRETVLKAMKGARILHFAGHGVLRPDAPWSAHLRLARQTRLTLGDLLTARPAVGTAVLNGCSTGVHLDLGGEERIGLPTGFLIAGAGMVLATRADIPDTAARRFIDRFYAAGGGRTPARAFRDAVRASVAAEDAVWKDFEMMGRP